MVKLTTSFAKVFDGWAKKYNVKAGRSYNCIRPQLCSEDRRVGDTQQGYTDFYTMVG